MSIQVDLRLRQGDFARTIRFQSDVRVTALVGPSGCGKTTTLHAIAGLVRPESGRICLGGQCLFDAAARIDVPVAARRLGLVFQDGRLFPHLRVGANLGYAGRADAGDIADMAARLGITPLLDRWPRHLSGGEARRVALGRALLSRPAALLLDEPLAHLDAARAGDLLALIADISDVPMLYVTHDLREAEQLGATIIALTSVEV